MIVGSYYLSKKAKKAYRKHQAEKVAKQITAGIDVVDPSDELQVKAPPGSPVGHGLTPSSTYSEDYQGSDLSSATSKERYPAGSQSTSSPASPRSSHWISSATPDRSPEFARFNARDPDRMLPPQPPSYDWVINSPPASHAPMIAYGPFDHAHAPFMQGYQAHNHTHDGCPGCMAMMQHHHYHQSHFQPTSAPPMPGSWEAARAAELDSAKPAVASELPAQPVPPSTKDLESMAEMPDTSRVVELAAELPADFAELSVGGTSARSSAPAELPSETTDSESEEVVDRSGEWKAAAPVRE